MSQIVHYSHTDSTEVVAAFRRNIEASGMRVLEEPEILRVRNDDYIVEPNAPTWVYRLTFEVKPEKGPG